MNVQEPIITVNIIRACSTHLRAAQGAKCGQADGNVQIRITVLHICNQAPDIIVRRKRINKVLLLRKLRAQYQVAPMVLQYRGEQAMKVADTLG